MRSSAILPWSPITEDAMPWALIEVRRQWSREEEIAIIDAVHAALVAAFRIPAEDKASTSGSTSRSD
jgi:hypothetical protein